MICTSREITGINTTMNNVYIVVIYDGSIHNIRTLKLNSAMFSLDIYTCIVLAVKKGLL